MSGKHIKNTISYINQRMGKRPSTYVMRYFAVEYSLLESLHPLQELK